MDSSIERPTSNSWRVSEIATQVHGLLSALDDAWITGVSDLRDAHESDIVFAESASYLDLAMRSRAGAVLTRADLVPRGATGRALILVENPRLAFLTVLDMFAVAAVLPDAIDTTAKIDPTAHVGDGVRIGPSVAIGPMVSLGDGVVLMAGVHIGEDCDIGAGTIVHPNAVIYPRVHVGRRCILHAGCVLGADGFGYIQVGHELRKVPHLGTVEIGDDVEIGANTCVDRGKTGATSIGSGTKIDNLVHIAHNVRIGRSCLIIAQVGIAGSVEIGDGVILAGQAGVADHISIGDGARVGAQGGVIGDVGPGETVSGYPARPHRSKMRELAAAAAMPEALKRLRSAEKRLSALEGEHRNQ